MRNGVLTRVASEMGWTGPAWWQRWGIGEVGRPVVSRRVLAKMILVLAACAGLWAVGGCSNGSPAASHGTVQPPTQSAQAAAVPTAASAAGGTPTRMPASSSATASARGGPGGYSADLNLKDSQGDTYTQSFTFGSPQAEASVPDAVSGVQSCQLGVAIPARNLVVPVQVTTTLTTSVQTQIPIQLYVSDFPQPGPDAGIPGVVV